MPPKEIFEPRLSTENRGRPLWMAAGQSVREQFQYTCVSPRSNGFQRELSFLRYLMLYGEADERQQMEEQLFRTERKERCVRRAMYLMSVLMGVALAGLAYSAVLVQDFPPVDTHAVIRIFAALGLASLVSLLAFAAFWLVARAEMHDQVDECRRLVSRIIETQLGKPPDGFPGANGRKHSSD